MLSIAANVASRTVDLPIGLGLGSTLNVPVGWDRWGASPTKDQARYDARRYNQGCV